jgi:aminoglycoside phosphotransferase (APT) family kinase protein
LDPGLEPLPAGLSSHAWRIHSAGGDLVLRMPIHAEDGVGTYPTEHALLARLTDLGAPVPVPIQGSWTLPGWPLEPFSLTSFVPGVALRPESRNWAARQVAQFLRLLHGPPITGYGPLVERAGQLVGTSTEAEEGLLAAFFGQPLWPFGGTSLAAHPALTERSDLMAAIEAHASAIRRAALDEPAVIVHSDLHEENILEDLGRVGFIDFGECFAGPAGWDFAALAYFGGWPWAEDNLDAYLPDRESGQIADSVAPLGLSVGIYRWEQDRRQGVDGDAHNEAFLLETLARLGGDQVAVPVR